MAPCIHETYETIWLIIGAFSLFSMFAGGLLGYGLGETKAFARRK